MQELAPRELPQPPRQIRQVLELPAQPIRVFVVERYIPGIQRNDTFHQRRGQRLAGRRRNIDWNVIQGAASKPFLQQQQAFIETLGDTDEETMIVDVGARRGEIFGADRPPLRFSRLLWSYLRLPKHDVVLVGYQRIAPISASSR